LDDLKIQTFRKLLEESTNAASSAYGVLSSPEIDRQVRPALVEHVRRSRSWFAASRWLRRDHGDEWTRCRTAVRAGYVWRETEVVLEDRCRILQVPRDDMVRTAISSARGARAPVDVTLGISTRFPIFSELDAAQQDVIEFGFAIGYGIYWALAKVDGVVG
jgi:hypothetical protein